MVAYFSDVLNRTTCKESNLTKRGNEVKVVHGDVPDWNGGRSTRGQ